MGKQLKFWAAAITAIGFTLGLIGCSTSEEKPSPMPSTAPPPVSQTPSPSPSPPEEPTVETVRPDIDIPEPKKYPEMANDDLDGADTAARYFLDLYGYAYNTGDLKAWKKLIDPECEQCNFVIEQVEEQYKSGGWYENVEMLHKGALIYYPVEGEPFYIVIIDVTLQAYEFYDSTGTLIYSKDEVNFPEYSVGVQYLSPNEWKVVGAAEMVDEK